VVGRAKLSIMAPPVDPELLDAAVDMARRAGELTLEHFRAPNLAVDQKDDGTPVTAADRGAERLLRELIGERFGDDTIIGEEEAEHTGTSGRRWVLDPIDGTKAFTRGVPLYSTLLAFEDEHGPAIGVINLPALGEAVYAGRGLGCFSNGVPVHVSDVATVKGSYLSSSSFSHWDEDALLAVKRAGAELRTWGDGYGFALVATGRMDAMVDPLAAYYDLAAMPVILAEAGGRFTDLAGGELADGGSGMATNGKIHDELQQLLGGGEPS
jgi:histidinol phosphatase-like enzyme (inositol monophosphatase family)